MRLPKPVLFWPHGRSAIDVDFERPERDFIVVDTRVRIGGERFDGYRGGLALDPYYSLTARDLAIVEIRRFTLIQGLEPCRAALAEIEAP